MRGTLAILAASLCIVAASAVAVPRPGQDGAAVALNDGSPVAVSSRKLLHGDDYDHYNWHHYNSYDDEVYKVAKWAIKVLYKSEYLLKTVFGGYYDKHYKPQYIRLVDAYYYVDRHYNKWYKLSIYFQYHGHFFTYDFIVYAPYPGRNHYYSPKYLYEIIYGSHKVNGKWWY